MLEFGVHDEIAAAMTELMDQLLQEGWYLDTWQHLDDWPDTWALIRDWNTLDPRKIPDDPIHRLRFGATVVRDVVGFWSDGTAVARRICLVDDATQWSRSGPSAEVVTSVITLDAPKDCGRDNGRSDLRWAATTTRILALFRARDWRLDYTDGSGHFQYTRGVGSAELNRPRFHEGQIWGPLGIMPLTCNVSPELDVQIIGWRVQTGCEAHRGVCETTGFHDPEFAVTLDRFESAARTTDLAALAYCVVYGDCSTHELDLSKEYPAETDNALPHGQAQLSGGPQ